MLPNEIQPISVFHASALHSGLVTAAQWSAAEAAVRSRLAAPDQHPPQSLSDAIAEYLVEHGTLTHYQAHQLRTGRTKLNLGPYLITDWIGQGGMGQVFKAVHQVMGRQCAVKVLPLQRATPEARESFLREIRLQAGLDCPYLVRAFDAGQDGNVHYLVTEYVPGTDLRRLIRSRGPMPMEQAAAVVMQAALGLDYAHRQGLVHRDVKPGNVLVTPDGHAKVSDVGLAAWSMGLDADPRAGKIVGTADYLSPEQIRSPLSVGPASDIYSLGCTLYYTVCGKVPFPGGDTASKCRRHCEETPWHPRKFVPELDEEFVEIIADMMEKDPARRMQSAAEVARRLEPWAGGISDVAERLLDHDSWQTPPPPSESLIAGAAEPNWGQPPRDGGVAAPEDLDAAETGSDSGLGRASAVPPQYTPLAGDQSGTRPAASRRRSSTWHVAVALAIAIPVSLLIGAVAGFYVRDWMPLSLLGCALMCRV